MHRALRLRTQCGQDSQSEDNLVYLYLGVIVLMALQGAASIAGLMIMTEAMVAEVPGPPPPELPGHHDHEDNLDIEF
jgi:chaperonin GroEL